MSYKTLRDYCMRADLVDSGWVIKEIDKSNDKIIKLKETLAQIAMMAGDNDDDVIQSIALGVLK